MLLNVLCVVIWHATNINWSTVVFVPHSEQISREWKWRRQQQIATHTIARKIQRKTVHEIETKHKRSRVHRQNWILKRLTSLIRTPTTFGALFFLHCFGYFFLVFFVPIVFLSFCSCRRALCMPRCNKCHGVFFFLRSSLFLFVCTFLFHRLALDVVFYPESFPFRSFVLFSIFGCLYLYVCITKRFGLCMIFPSLWSMIFV